MRWLVPVLRGGLGLMLVAALSAAAAVADATGLARTEAPAASPTIDGTLAVLRAGRDDRERALALAARLEALDLEELVVWEELVAAFPPAALASEGRAQESAMRLGALPLLAARQRRYRALELELGRGLPGDTSAGMDPAALGLQVARLASIREWSGLTEQAQRQVRSTLDAVHAVALARALKDGMRPDAAARAALGRIVEQRAQLEAARAEATIAWESARDAAHAALRRDELALAAAVAQAAARNEAVGESLRQRAAAEGPSASRRDWLDRTARALTASARFAGRRAADLAGVVDAAGDAFASEPREAAGHDPELAGLLTERRRIAAALRASLAQRLATLGELKALAEQRERLLAGADYLAPDSDRARAHATVRAAGAAFWQRVDELRLVAGDIAGAASGDRALAAERLAVATEALVSIEAQLHALAQGRLLDLSPSPADPRLGAAAPRWRADVDALRVLDERWTAWRAAWDPRVGAEAALLDALRGVAMRLNVLWVARLEPLVRALPAPAADDDIGRLTADWLGSLAGQARIRASAGRELGLLSDALVGDPVVGPVLQSTGDAAWSQASSGLRDLPELFAQVAHLRGAGRLVEVATNAALPSRERLTALMALAEALDLPWLALEGSAGLRLVTEVGGQTYRLEDIEADAPRLRRQVEYLVQAPLRWRVVATAGLQLAQAQAAPGPRSSLLWDPAVPLVLGGKNILRTLHYTREEVKDNWWVYLAMPPVGAAVGAVLGTPLGPAGTGGGALAGVKAGGAAAVVAFSEDALAGGAKGLVTGLAQDVQLLAPAEVGGYPIRDYARSVEKSFPMGVDVLKGLLPLTKVLKRGLELVRHGHQGVDALRESGALRRNIEQGFQRLDDLYARIGQLTVQQVGSRALPAAERAAIDLALRTTEAERAAIRNVVERMIQQDLVRRSPEFLKQELLKWTATVVAETVSDLNDATGPVQPILSRQAERLMASLIVAMVRAAADPSSLVRQAADAIAADPEAERALALNRQGAQQRGAGTAPRPAAGPDRRAGAGQPGGPTEANQIIPREWEIKAELDELRRLREHERKEKEEKDRKDQKDPKDPKDKDAGTGEVKNPVQPVRPEVDPEPTPAGPEKRYWYGWEVVITYKVRGAPCSQTLSGEVFGTRAEAEQAMRDAGDRALRAEAGTRTEPSLRSRRLYAGPLTERPSYSGPTGLKAIQCGTAPTPAAPAVPAGIYEPKGNGQACPQVGQQIHDRCAQITQECNSRNCSGGGYSGCAVDCPGCGGWFADYTAWCVLHPSYESRLSAGLSVFVADIKACIAQFLADGKPGRRERGAECQGKALKKLAEKKDGWVQQACEARCAQDGRRGVAVLGGGRHRCECR